MEFSEIGQEVNDENIDEDIKGPSPDQLWKWYMEVEGRFIEYCEYVPLREEHYKVWSLKLASIIIEICSILDSFFKVGSSWLFDYPEIDSSKFTDERRKIEGDKPNIYIWKKVYDAFYGLNEKKIHVIPLRKSVCPFGSWKNGSELEWWNAYNDIKHDRFRELEKASLENTLFALASLFLAIVVHVPIKPYLFDIGIIEFRGLIDPCTNYRCLDMLLRKEPAIIYRDSSIIASTSLFSYEYQKTGHSQYVPIGGRLVGGLAGWQTSKIWPECEQECIGKIWRECYRKSPEFDSILKATKSND
ncbi:MAG: hypothetical protein HXS48_09720 [Theionarchaea archaeon]|nr:hypothetical protein [Theionarchaea archaeon]